MLWLHFGWLIPKKRAGLTGPKIPSLSRQSAIATHLPERRQAPETHLKASVVGTFAIITGAITGLMTGFWGCRSGCCGFESRRPRFGNARRAGELALRPFRFSRSLGLVFGRSRHFSVTHDLLQQFFRHLAKRVQISSVNKSRERALITEDTEYTGNTEKRDFFLCFTTKPLFLFSVSFVSSVSSVRISSTPGQSYVTRLM